VLTMRLDIVDFHERPPWRRLNAPRHAPAQAAMQTSSHGNLRLPVAARYDSHLNACDDLIGLS
jgi:hypothetical protein